MKINQINIENFCGIASFDQATPAPITLIAGANGTGKSSIIEGVNLAITGEYTRVGKKKEFSQLVNDQADKGSIKVATSEGDFNINLPTGSGTQAKTQRMILSLTHGMFTSMSLDDQRQVIFKLAKTEVSDQIIFEELANRGYNKLLIKELDLSDLNKAVKQANDKAKAERSAWKGLTGENYGAKKADDWQAPLAETVIATVEPPPQGRIDHLQEDLQKAIQERGQLQARLENAGKHNRRQAFLLSEVAQGNGLKSNLAIYQTQLAETNSKIESLQASTASDEFKALIADKLDRLHSEYSKEYRAKFQKEPPLNEPDNWFNLLLDDEGCPVGDSKNDIAQRFFHVGGKSGISILLSDMLEEMNTSHDTTQLATYRQEVNNLTAEIAKLNQRLADLAEKQKELNDMEQITISSEVEKQIAELDNHITATQQIINEVQAQQRQYDMAQGSNQQVQKNAEQVTAKAQAMHSQVKMWTAIAELLSPNGDIGKMLGQAVQPFNEQLQIACDCIKWSEIRFDYENGMMFDNRPYRLLSESEKWRVDTAISYAISQLSDSRIFAIDRFDVLDLASRLPVLKWLDGLAELGSIDSVIVAGTFKEKVQCPPTFNSIWLEGE